MSTNAHSSATGFAVSPDGSRLPLAVQGVNDGSSQNSVASEILVIDMRTGAGRSGAAA